MRAEPLKPPATAVVTGATSGIGLALTDWLLAEGWHVLAVGRRAEVLGENDVSKRPGFLRALCTDLSTDEGIERVRAVFQSGAEPPIRLLINAAGAGFLGEAESLPWEEHRALFRLLYDCPAELTREALRFWRKSAQTDRPGSSFLVVQAGSLVAQFPQPFMAAYNAAKAALSVDSRSLRLELAERGDHHFFIAELQLGNIATPFNNPMLESLPDASELSPHLLRAVRAQERALARAPGPATAVRRLARLLARPASGSWRTGSFFESRIAPLGLRLFPERLLDLLLRYY